MKRGRPPVLRDGVGRIGIKLGLPTDEFLRAEAKSIGCGLSELVRTILDAYVEAEKETKRNHQGEGEAILLEMLGDTWRN